MEMMEKPWFWSTSEVSMKNPTKSLINNEDDDALERQVETDMTEDELQQFEEDWTNLWNSDITFP